VGTAGKKDYADRTQMDLKMIYQTRPRGERMRAQEKKLKAGYFEWEEGLNTALRGLTEESIDWT